MNVTTALILRLAKMAGKEQDLILKENPGTNFALMIRKCDEQAELANSRKQYDLAEKIEDLKFFVTCYQHQHQKTKDAVEVEAYETQSS